jgi:hypothetical protein
MESPDRFYRKKVAQPPGLHHRGVPLGSQFLPFRDLDGLACLITVLVFRKLSQVASYGVHELLFATGKVNRKTAPLGSFAPAHNRPPCASTIERQIERPNPNPPGLVV